MPATIPSLADRVARTIARVRRVVVVRTWGRELPVWGEVTRRPERNQGPRGSVGAATLVVERRGQSAVARCRKLPLIDIKVEPSRARQIDRREVEA